MSDKHTKDLSLSDIDIKMDLDMASDAKMYPKRDVFKKKDMHNTLDLYKDEMSRAQVQKLLQSHTEPPLLEKEMPETESEAIKPEEIKPEAIEPEAIEPEAIKPEAIEEVETAETETESDYIEKDYQYMISLLSETTRESAPPEHTARRSVRSSEEKRTTVLPSAPIRIMVAIILLFSLIAFAALVISVNVTQKALETAKEEIELLKQGSDDYERLKIDMDVLKDEREQLQAENNLLQLELAQVRNDHNEDSSPSAAVESNSEITSDGPQNYVVQNGDSFWRISANFYNDGNLYKYIMEANNIRNESDLFPGMPLIIPDLGGTHAN